MRVELKVWRRFYTRGWLALAGLVLACTNALTDIVPPPPPPLPASPFIVSNPVPSPGPEGTAGSAAATLEPTVVYISLPPGAIPNGVAATMRDLRTGSSITAVVVDGGFDPVALPAIEGDTIAIRVQTTGAASPLMFRVIALARTRPSVVRTSPTRNKRDVPLNSIVVIVFSEPLDPASVDTGSVKLWRGATPVAGTVQFADAAQLRAEFHPDAILAAGTDYLLIVTQEVQNVNGLALDSVVSVPFTTGSTAPLSLTSVTAGGNHSCSLSATGAAICWGYNASGQVGSLSAETCGGGISGSGFESEWACRTAPAVVGGGITFTELTGGGEHTCGLNPGGQAYCWGEGGYGALGHGALDSRSAPIAVVGGLSFRSLATGYAHTCGVTVLGAAYCWGLNTSGQLGDGTIARQTAPVAVTGGLSFVRLSAGNSHTCGITTGARLYCWGLNVSGQLGDGSLARRRAPAAVMGNLSAVSLVAGNDRTCAITTAGDGYCWGSNHRGALGDGTTSSSPFPVAVAGGTKWKSITAGGSFTCGIASNALAHCWGDISYGQLGIGSVQEQRTPAPVIGGLVFESLSAGGAHACGRTTSGRLYCWGAGQTGQLGIGGAVGRSAPSLVLGQP